MSDKFDDDKDRSGSDRQPIADETRLRGGDSGKAEPNNDATVVRSEDVGAAEPRNDDATILRPKQSDSSRDQGRNDDRDSDSDGAPEKRQAPSNDETL
ncbi:MAG: hypothetical protein ACI9P7_002487, partial [Candidatus Azotimanducaceae bacterium]